MKNQNLLNKKSCLVLVLILLLLLGSCSAVSSGPVGSGESPSASEQSAQTSAQENPYDPKPEGVLMIPPSEDAVDARYDKFYYNVEHQEGRRKIESVFYGIDNPSQEEGSRLMVNLKIICKNGACPDLIARSENVESRNQGSKTIYTIYYWNFGSAELKELSLDENVTSIEFFDYGYESDE